MGKAKEYRYRKVDNIAWISAEEPDSLDDLGAQIP
jgi:hypothetical protein